MSVLRESNRILQKVVRVKELFYLFQEQVDHNLPYNASKRVKENGIFKQFMSELPRFSFLSHENNLNNENVHSNDQSCGKR